MGAKQAISRKDKNTTSKETASKKISRVDKGKQSKEVAKKTIKREGHMLKSGQSSEIKQSTGVTRRNKNQTGASMGLEKTAKTKSGVVDPNKTKTVQEKPKKIVRADPNKASSRPEK